MTHPDHLILETIDAVACCLQTSLRGVFNQYNSRRHDDEAFMPAPETVYTTDQPDTPICLCHGFAYICYAGSNPYSLNNEPKDCLKGYKETFEIIVGQCAPPPAAVLLKQGKACDSASVYGSCPPCGEKIDLSAFNNQDDKCVYPKIDSGKGFEWPQIDWQPPTVTQFAHYLIRQRFILRKYFLNVFCQCFNDPECGPVLKSKADFSLVEIDKWCDGQMQGTRMVISGNVG